MRNTGNGYPIINMMATGERIRELIDGNGYTIKDIRDYLGLNSVQSVYHWIHGKSMPTIDNIYALSGLFGVSIDSIIMGNRDCDSDKGSFFIAPRSKRIFDYFEKICELEAG